MKPVLALVALALLPRAGWACSCVVGGDHGGFTVPAEVELPSNARGLLWQGYSIGPGGALSHPGKASFAVRRLDAGGRGEVPFHLESTTIPSVQEDDLGAALLVVPDTGLAPGGLYEFRYLQVDGMEPRVVKVRVSSRALHFAAGGESPIRVGKSEVAGLAVATRAGSCAYQDRADQRGVEIELPQGAREWEEALFYLFFVDGKRWSPAAHLCKQYWQRPGESWVGLRKQLLFSLCSRDRQAEATDSLAPGPHRLEVIAWLPGTDEVLRAATEVSLGCPAVNPANPADTVRPGLTRPSSPRSPRPGAGRGASPCRSRP